MQQDILRAHNSDFVLVSCEQLNSKCKKLIEKSENNK